MRLVIVCGNEECRKEHTTDTNDRMWECPHCGRQRENTYYPFLTARMMQSRIDGDAADWETVCTEAYDRADVKVQEKMLRLRRLEQDVELPEGYRYPDPMPMLETMKETGDCDNSEWRARHDQFIQEARKVVVAMEDRIKELEVLKEDRKKGKGRS